MTNEELDALVQRLTWAAGIDQAEYPFPLCNDAADAITTLRAQLAEVRAELAFVTENRNNWQDTATRRWFRAEEALARADRAEAERAAQIEADAGIAEAQEALAAKRANDDDADARSDWDAGLIFGTQVGARLISASIRVQPHDRTALDAMLRAERENALREAADMIRSRAYTSNGDGRSLEPVSAGLVGMDMHHATIADAIIALIPREIGSGGKT